MKGECFMGFNFEGIISIKKNGEFIYKNNQYCKSNREETSCKKSVGHEVICDKEVLENARAYKKKK